MHWLPSCGRCRVALVVYSALTRRLLCCVSLPLLVVGCLFASAECVCFRCVFSIAVVVVRWFALHDSAAVCVLLPSPFTIQADLADKRTVQEADAKEFANELNIQFLETSAKEATNVENAFLTMAYEIKQRMANAGPEVGNPQTGPKLTGGTNVKKKSCC